MSELNASPPSEHGGTTTLLKIVYDKIYRDDIPLRASALAYSTLVSLVPILALVLVMLSGPAFEKSRERVLDRFTATLLPSENAEAAAASQAKFKDTFRAEIGTLASNAAPVSLFGFLLLVGTAGMLFVAAESSFNAIWRVSSERPFFIRVAIATSMLFWGPIMLASSISISEFLGDIPLLGNYLVPVAFTTAVFTSFFMLMPHARVLFTAALAGGFATAVCWELAKAGFVYYVTNIVSYSAIYGSLGLIPMLFLWVYINWLLIMAGAELAYCLQHRRTMLEQWLLQQREERRREQFMDMVPPGIALAAAIEVARRFKQAGAGAGGGGAGGGVRVSALAQALHIEPGLAQKAAEFLARSGILSRVLRPEADEGTQDDPAFLPAADPQNCSVSTLLGAALEGAPALGRGSACDQARLLMQRAAQATQKELAAMTLKDLAEFQEAESAEAKKDEASGSLGESSAAPTPSR